MAAALPIDAILPQLLAELRRGSSAVVRAPTGSGKTTRVPPAMLDAGLAGKGAILVLQPRRVAARATAAWMAHERGTELGREIGYQTRFERRAGRDSRVVCITEGILLRRLLDDPFLEGVAAIVFDEFHERNLASDLALGMVRQVQLAVRPELRIVVMSATLDPTPIATYLGDCARIESQGRTFPVVIEHVREIERRPIEELAAAGVHDLLPRTPGDLLVFLPGVGEIKASAKRLANLEREGLAIHQLYGDLPPDQQDAVLLPGRRRKVILATNVAETSLTIEGVTGVVDTGLARIASYDEHTGLDRLELLPISRASADQRAGRAGRTAPGICLRLWPEAAHRARPEMETPEIHRVDLAGALLQLACWIEPDPEAFPWFETPRPASLSRANRLLRQLEALDDRGITPLGRAMVRMPLHPRLARMLMEGERLGQGAVVALAAALLSERNPFMRGQPASGRRRPNHTSASDLLDRVAALEAFERQGTRDSELGSINPAAAHTILRVRDQLLRSIGEAEAKQSTRTSVEEAVLRSVLVGYPDRVARRREQSSRRGVMVGGRGVRLAENSAVDQAELFVCLDVEGSSGEALVRMASAVERDWLPESLLTKRVDVFFDPMKKQVTARRRVLWDDLVLEESPAALPDGEATSQALAAAAVEHWDTASPTDNETLTNFIHRVRFLQRTMPDLELPAMENVTLQALLPQLCAGRRSLEDLRRAPWLDHVRGLFTYQQLQAVEREAPERVAVPSGSRIGIDYSGERPVLAVRIQELFGLAETPRVAGGRVAVLMHLLAPNMRPQQITDDLTSFWNNTYQQVRKDLRARYPKHAWPEDPWNALPQRRPQRPRQ